ncbi:YafY family transcriptional regulator [Actinoplanes sp. LDG1-01]|uniref:YafY family transcriptional regulator n=1 Tax=Paractinoplanes lichenicola TaxID=2802976 RepID=A0ABS1VWB3_9ACTN|nr:YafY family transcriptional regulator [Actinoplanes lichenicola]
MLGLLEILQGGGTRTTAELAARLEVDERTVRRYVGQLLDLEVPVESVRGRYGGYRLAPGFRMPPLMLTDEEALAVLLGLNSSSGEAAESAAAKVRRVLPKALQARLAAVFATTEFTAPAAASPEASVLLRLAEAARQRHSLLIGYADRHGVSSERTLSPYGIVAHHGRWYVTGHDASSGELRTFRLDRIGWVRPTGETFEVPDDFDPAATVLAGLAGTPWRYQVVVRVNGSADEVRAGLPQGLATIEADDEDGWVVVRMRAERLDWVPGVLGGLGRPFVVREPAALRDLVGKWVHNFSANLLALGREEC